jgi:transposase
MSALAEVPEVEVSAKARRRRFTGEYKRKILQQVDSCTKAGEIGALLRREGLYSSLLATWRRQRESGELAGLSPKKRGRKGRPVDERDRKLAEQQLEIARLTPEQSRPKRSSRSKKSLTAPGIKLPDSDSTGRR